MWAKTDGLPFFTMKFASGGSLARTRGTLRQEPRQCVLLMAKVALAVEYAHNQGVLHRDLKPGNILLDHRQEPLVSDFGLAKWQDTSTNLTRSLAIFGTPGYIAPEQAEGPVARQTAAADVYSLGAILFELLARRAPFLGENALVVMRQASDNAAPRLRSLAPHLDRDLETICARCLEREPSARYQSAATLAQDLNSWLDRRPISARPVGGLFRCIRWIRRNRVLAGTLSVCVLLGATSLLWQIRGGRLQSAMSETTLAARSVVVMPFLNLDSLTPDPILARSVASSLQTELNLFGPARVTSMGLGTPMGSGSTEEVRKSGRDAHARTVLTGTERTIRGKKRVSFRLVDAATSEPLLVHVAQEGPETIPGQFNNETISRQVYAILSARDWSDIKRSRDDPGLRDEVAREAILSGRDLMLRYTTSDLDRAIALFRKAIRKTPDSSMARSYLAFAATARTHYIADWSYLKIGREEATKAIQLSPNFGDAHRALASVYYQEGRFSEALEEGMQTIETSGLEDKAMRFMGMTLDTMGCPDRALNWFKCASRLRGIRGDMDAQIGDCWVKLGEDKQALDAYSRSTELQPDRPEGAVGTCHTRMLEGDFEMARKLYQTGQWNANDLGERKAIGAQIEFFARNFKIADQLYGDLAATDPDGGGTFYGAISYQSALGRLRQIMGDKRSGNELLARCLAQETAATAREPENSEAFYRLAAVESSLGLLDSSMNHLRVASRFGWLDYRSLDLDPRFDAMRPNPGFQRIINDLSVKVADMRSKIRNQ